MGLLPAEVRVVMVGGTSHVGKSTVAGAMAEALKWELRSTDTMARHPGRPWRDDGSAVPGHVVEHFGGKLSVEELMADVLRHYEVNVVPQVEALVKEGTGLVIEGSALWPGFVGRLVAEQVAAVWLTAGEEVIERRMLQGSGYAEKGAEERRLIETFLARTVAFQKRMEAEARGRGLTVMEVMEGETVESVVGRCVGEIEQKMNKGKRG